ncbi:hypothetical protein JG687_00009166 [Phytophthora cactorum]|uniref:Uncharacterized protein n=1 Tax=Phytophthora cactorum TaxID=29920 RepID=A0A8T1UAF3_9STRA|nr:hypothetical protein JG687_00009166 [Phytophthora cactorum]
MDPLLANSVFNFGSEVWDFWFKHVQLDAIQIRKRRDQHNAIVYRRKTRWKQEKRTCEKSWSLKIRCASTCASRGLRYWRNKQYKLGSRRVRAWLRPP